MTPPILHCQHCNTRLTHVRNTLHNGTWVNHYRCPDCRRSGHTTHTTVNEPIMDRVGPAVNPDHNQHAADTVTGDVDDSLPVPDGGHNYLVVRPEIVAGFNDRKQADKFATRWSESHDEPHVVAKSDAAIAIEVEEPEVSAE